MSAEKYHIRTNHFDIQISCRPSTGRDNTSTHARLDAALETAIIEKYKDRKLQTDFFSALGRWRLDRVFHAFNLPVPDAAVENPPTFHIADDLCILEVGNTGYSMRFHTIQIGCMWLSGTESRTIVEDKKVRHHYSISTIVSQAPTWLDELVRDFSLAVVLDVFKLVWKRTPLTESTLVDKMLLRHHLCPVVAQIFKSKRQMVNFAVVIYINGTELKVFNDHVETGFVQRPAPPWLENLLMHPNLLNILKDIINAL